MPELRFTIDIGTVVSPLLLICVAVIANQVKKAVMAHMDAKHAENTLHLDRIETQTTATNGRVTKIEEHQAEHERDAKADHDMLLTLKGTVETLMGLSKGAPPL